MTKQEKTFFEDIELLQLHEGETESVVSPTTSKNGTVFFIPNEQLQQRPGKDHKKPLKNHPRTNKDHPRTTHEPPKTTFGVSKTTQGPVLLLQNELPSGEELLAEMKSKWFVIEILHDDVYHSSDPNIQSFEQLFQSLTTGEIRTCPRPLEAELTKALGFTLSRNTVTRTLALFYKYKKEFYPHPFWLAVDNFLERFDRFLTLLILKA